MVQSQGKEANSPEIESLKPCDQISLSSRKFLQQTFVTAAQKPLI